MGFLSAWDEPQRIDVSDLADELPGTWWVDVKKCLPHDEADEVLRLLMRSTIKMGDPSGDGPGVRTALSTDSVADQQAQIVVRSIIGWNLTDRNGVVLPFEKDESLENPYQPLEHSLKLLPSPVYDRVAKVVVAANTEKKEETGAFPPRGQGRDSHGAGYTPNDQEVLV